MKHQNFQRDQTIHEIILVRGTLFPVPKQTQVPVILTFGNKNEKSIN